MKKRRMNKKHLARIITWVFAYALAGLLGYKAYASFAPSSLEIVYSDIYSDKVKEKIDGFVQAYIAESGTNRINVALFSKKLKEKFKIVQKVSWEWGSFSARISIEGSKPLLRVNNSLICSEDCDFFPYDCFLNTTLDNLKHCYVESEFVEHGVDPSVCRVFENIARACWDEYTVSYSCSHLVLLQNNDAQKKLRVIIDDNTGFDEKKMDMVMIAYDDFLNHRWDKSWRKLRKNECVVCDLRFKNRIYTKVVHL